MAEPTEIAPFRQGAGRYCLDFIRTLRYRGTADATEELADPAALAAWIRQFGPCAADRASLPSWMQVSEARTLREAINELIIAARGTAGVGSCPAAARNQVNRVAALPVPAPALHSAGRVTWHADDPVSATLALVSRDALDLVASAAILRVRRCANRTCGVLFFDSSRPGTRRWCSMGTCGNQAKKATLRSKVPAG
jgi:predicted RNA-binding Zn ribbon-like protein